MEGGDGPASTSATLERHGQRVDRLGACPLLAGATRDDLVRLADLVHETNAPAGETFIRQGTAGDCFYVIADGAVQVYAGGDEAGESILATLGPGQSIGEMGYFTSGRRSASARAVGGPVELLSIFYRDLPRCFELVPNLANGFMRMLTERLHELNQQYDASVDRTRASEQVLRYLSEYLDLSAHVNVGAGIDALIDRVVKTASKLLGADRATLFLLDAATGELWSKVAQGEGVREIRVPAGQGFVGWVARNGQTLNIADAYQDARFNQETDRRTGYRTQSVLCGPVRSLGGDVIGVIQVINKHDGAFTDLDERLFRAFAHQAAIAVENSKLYQQLSASHEKMAIMLDVATSVTQTLDLPSLIRKTVAKVTDILRCDRSSFFVLDREAGELWSMEAHGAGLTEIRFPMTAGLAGHTARTGEVVNVADAYDDARFNQAFDRASGYRTRSVLCVPTRDREGRVTGVTQAINKDDGRPFGDEDAALLLAIAAQIGVAVENAQLYARTVRMKTYLESVQESISNGILTLDDEYRVITVNRAARAILGPQSAEWAKQDLRAVFRPGNNYLLGMVDKAYAGGAGVTTPDVELLRDGGQSSSTVNASVLPLRSAEADDDAGHGLVVVLEDVTREKRIKSLLVKKMAKDVVERLLSDPQMQQLGGRTGPATILFSDIREFTAISEAVTAPQLVEMLNAYFTVMVEEVHRHDGILDKFIGDAIMALFGVPFPAADDAARAVRTALRMRAALAPFNAERVARGLRPIRIGIGVNTGDVVYGNIGSESRSDFTVIGDAVNLASRLEGLNKQYGTEVLISEFTRDAIGDDDAFVLRAVDHVRVKGKGAPTTIYEVLGERGHRPTDAQARFGHGLDAYRRREFPAALAHFRAGAADDPLCEVFACRCEHFHAKPPPPDWDGVWLLDSK